MSFLEIYESNNLKRSGDDFENGTKPRLSGDPNQIIIDNVAMDLEVERRRIYDVVNILEALQIVVKKGKNTYGWKGRDHLTCQFALMQHEAIEAWPERAVEHGIIDSGGDYKSSAQGNESDKEESKSLTRLSQLFLHVFLVGFDNVNLPQVSDLIHGRKSSQYDLAKIGNQGQEPPKDPLELTKAASRGLKTKIRRLYDVANVFLAVGLLRKSENRIAATIEGKRPHYHWNYKVNAKELRAVYEALDSRTIAEQNPFLEDIKVEAKEASPIKPRIEKVVSLSSNSGSKVVKVVNNATLALTSLTDPAGETSANTLESAADQSSIVASNVQTKLEDSDEFGADCPDFPVYSVAHQVESQSGPQLLKSDI